MINFKISKEEAHALEVYLLVTTRFREGEVEANKKLYDEFKETPFFDEETVNKFKDNIEFWQSHCETMSTLQARLKILLSSPQNPGKEDNNENR